MGFPSARFQGKCFPIAVLSPGDHVIIMMHDWILLLLFIVLYGWLLELEIGIGIGIGIGTWKEPQALIQG